VANLPYSSGSKIIRHLLESPHPPENMVVTLQKEVAANLVADKGKESLLSIAVGIYATIKFLRTINPEHFDPPPKVDSAVVSILTRENPLVPIVEIPNLFKFVRAGFSSKRKQLGNSLANNLRIAPELMLESLLAAEIDPRRRPETITITEWYKLMKIHGDLDND
jgi:16S rRNA (adenine1518-N6/adenine1519-N6)-dimethyltransferase